MIKATAQNSSLVFYSRHKELDEIKGHLCTLLWNHLYVSEQFHEAEYEKCHKDVRTLPFKSVVSVQPRCIKNERILRFPSLKIYT